MRGLTRDVVLYVGSAWWRDCDPFVRVVATTAEACEKALQRAMEEAAEEAAGDDDEDDEEARDADDYLDDIAWSGVHPEGWREFLGEPKRAREDAKADLRATGIAYLDTY